MHGGLRYVPAAAQVHGMEQSPAGREESRAKAALPRRGKPPAAVAAAALSRPCRVAARPPCQAGSSRYAKQ